MIEENKKENIREEIKRAKEAMRAANLLFDNGFFNDAVSKLYYFLLYNVRALLLTKGLEPKSHEGALRLLGLHFVKKGIFSPTEEASAPRVRKALEERALKPGRSLRGEFYTEFKKE